MTQTPPVAHFADEELQLSVVSPLHSRAGQWQCKLLWKVTWSVITWNVIVLLGGSCMGLLGLVQSHVVHSQVPTEAGRDRGPVRPAVEGHFSGEAKNLHWMQLLCQCSVMSDSL